jgi:MFS family permease
MFGAVVIFGVATIVFALSTSFALSVGALVVLGAADVISVVIRSSLVQIKTPDEMRGRVSAVNSMFIGTSNQLGEFESGLTAALFGVVPAVLIGGAGTIVVVIIWTRLFPELLRIDSLKPDWADRFPSLESGSDKRMLAVKPENSGTLSN